MHRARIEGFATVSEVDNDRVHSRRIQRPQVKVQDLVAALDEIGNNCSSNHAAPARERDALAYERLSLPPTLAPDGPSGSPLFEDAQAGRRVLAHILHIELEPNSGSVASDAPQAVLRSLGAVAIQPARCDCDLVVQTRRGQGETQWILYGAA
jgi:hypothetical protein